MTDTKQERPNYRALMLREEARRKLDKALWEFEQRNGYRPTYSVFITLLSETYLDS
jgi:hypothetical protein